ncbi:MULTISPECIES: Trk system potassium transporter TrkA [unclassified Methylophaga]|jgi:trk system potassium uptake protein TrkA|uniref:Trk system potassium uptake protein TrkA n=1 Tax=Pseudidiomarina aestuarii TaxID=624146 RepID=A0A2T4CYC3_9GAMM|nr:MULTISPECIES: Trk system potassium transporter TrkA [unclassified Methylophaga]PTB86535.1 Trk system potassium transporter TrkA [Pseudidiomarina aestuarii]MAL50218.1 Trk system potassium transporter TrkA [Methylophaga sp.]MAP27491.1 Trk system potassium transporter TrkA [Methylophaga sp.]MBP25562.1 Trk system potassium transporter TrkA [Methylophaga sp.]HCN99536.1 Trk system potassium transporter TrkA [Methylophaga sp.]|tara:strand:+ start:506 stop:1879 length:1374 start_codon:yes stop_codon:yes gene_type:complete
MKILILGAGQVGASVAATLAREDDDITLVDTDANSLHKLQDHYDIRTVQGLASHPDVLERAGAADADLVLAVTNSDETNMVACQICHTLYNTPTKIARIRTPEYLTKPELFSNEAIAIDVLISPEQLVTDYIERLISHPNALQVLDFADGLVQLVAVRAFHGGPLVGNPLRELRKHIPKTETRVAAIFRNGKAILPEAETVIEADDEVFFIAASKDIRSVMAELRRLEKPYKRIMLAGGGNIGIRLARALEHDYQIKIIEANSARADYLSEELSKSIVLLGDVANEELLREEEIDNVDLFCALTNDDEANILSAMLAKRLGARKVLSLINRAAYVDLVESGTIDIALSPQQATIGSLLAHIRRGDIVAVHSLRRGAAEALEAIAHGDKSSSMVVGRRIDEIDLPPGTSIGAIVRGEEVIIAHRNTLVEAEDHVILFLTNKRYIKEVERLFQVGFTFF